MYFPIHSLVDVFFFRFFKNEENLKKNTSTSGCIEKYISLVKMYKKIRNRKIELKKDNNIYTYLYYTYISFPEDSDSEDKL